MEGTYLPADDFYTGAGTKQIQLSGPAFAHAVLPLAIPLKIFFSCGFGGGSKQMRDRQGCRCLGRVLLHVKLHASTVIDIHRSGDGHLSGSGDGHLSDQVDT